MVIQQDSLRSGGVHSLYEEEASRKDSVCLQSWTPHQSFARAGRCRCFWSPRHENDARHQEQQTFPQHVYGRGLSVVDALICHLLVIMATLKSALNKTALNTNDACFTTYSHSVEYQQLGVQTNPQKHSCEKSLRTWIWLDVQTLCTMMPQFTGGWLAV